MAAGGPPPGFDFNQWQQMQNASGGGASSGEALTPQKIIDTTGDGIAKFVGKFFGVDPELKSPLTGLEAPDGVGQGLSLNQGGILGIFKDTQGGVLASILKYFTRDLPPGLTDGVDGSGSGGGGDGGGGGATASGGGDFSGGDMPSMGGGGQSMEDVMVNYGGRMMAASNMVSDAIDVPIERVGNLQPPAASSVVARGEEMGIG